jgi:hypothetical protein
MASRQENAPGGSGLFGGDPGQDRKVNGSQANPEVKENSIKVNKENADTKCMYNRMAYVVKGIRWLCKGKVVRQFV